MIWKIQLTVLVMEYISQEGNIWHVWYTDQNYITVTAPVQNFWVFQPHKSHENPLIFCRWCYNCNTGAVTIPQTLMKLWTHSVMAWISLIKSAQVLSRYIGGSKGQWDVWFTDIAILMTHYGQTGCSPRTKEATLLITVDIIVNKYIVPH